MSTAWTSYGFPNLAMMPLRLPMLGIVRACNERASAVGASTMDEPGILADATAAPWDIDYFLKSLATSFIHGEEDTAAWTLPDLAASAVGAEYMDFYLSQGYILAPMWPAKWALQRRLVINKLRYAMVDGVATDLNSRFSFVEDTQ